MNPNPSKRAVNKNKNAVAKSTLDIQHNAHISKITEVQREINDLKSRLIESTTELHKLEQCLSSCEDEAERDELISKIIELKDLKIHCQGRITTLQDKYNPEKYFTDTASVLFQYYDIVEKGFSGGKTDKQIPVKPSTHLSSSTSSAPPNSILKFFAPTNSEVIDNTTQQSTNTTVNSVTLYNDNEGTRGSLLDQYMRLVNDDYISENIQYYINEKCKECGSKAIVTLANDGYVYCNTCHAIEYIVIDHEKPSYRDPPKEVSFYAYKRTNHLNEWLSQIQGKETTEIPEEVYDRILVITPKKIRDILRKLQINKYEHIPHIISRLTGRPMMQMPPDLEEKLRSMFKQVQTPFLRHSPRDRKNFLSYSYCLHKMLQLLGRDEYLHMFSLLKSRDKLAAQDQIWKKICDDLGWEYIPSA
jgi:uncharacterized Zn finger protein (UPF0148 family)